MEAVTTGWRPVRAFWLLVPVLLDPSPAQQHPLLLPDKVAGSPKPFHPHSQLILCSGSPFPRKLCTLYIEADVQLYIEADAQLYIEADVQLYSTQHSAASAASRKATAGPSNCTPSHRYTDTRTHAHNAHTLPTDHISLTMTQKNCLQHIFIFPK